MSRGRKGTPGFGPGGLHMKTVNLEILCAGFGGQGIMFMGKLLAQTGLVSGKHVTWMPSYGAEVRGGTAYSMTKISDDEIGSPLAARPNVFIAMNRPSFDKYIPRLREGGMLISNRSLVGDAQKPKGVAVINAPLTDLALKLGDVRVANMIAVGILLHRTKAFSMKAVVSALGDLLKGKETLFAINKKALERGYSISP